VGVKAMPKETGRHDFGVVEYKGIASVEVVHHIFKRAMGQLLAVSV
jgi:hypothetical protein